MSHIPSNASSVIAIWRRFTQFQMFNSKVQGFTRQIREIRNAVLTSTFTNRFDKLGTLQARAPQRAHCEPPQRRARRVAVAIGIALSIVPSPISQGVNAPIKSIEVLADIQLTEKQEYCHNLIAFKESSNNRLAVNGSHYGYYQGKSKALINAPDDYQFYWYWSYVSNRYGITEYDEPNYCKALHHLRVKGWQ